MFNLESTARFQRLQIAHEAERQQRQIQLLETEGQLRNAELSRVRTTRTALAVIAVLVIISLAPAAGALPAEARSEAQVPRAGRIAVGGARSRARP